MLSQSGYMAVGEWLVSFRHVCSRGRTGLGCCEWASSGLGGGRGGHLEALLHILLDGQNP